MTFVLANVVVGLLSSTFYRPSLFRSESSTCCDSSDGLPQRQWTAPDQPLPGLGGQWGQCRASRCSMPDVTEASASAPGLTPAPSNTSARGGGCRIVRDAFRSSAHSRWRRGEVWAGVYEEHGGSGGEVHQVR